MSKKSAVILASLISFFLGIVAQNLYSVSKKSWESLESIRDATFVQVPKTENSIKKKPFFPNSKASIVSENKEENLISNKVEAKVLDSTSKKINDLSSEEQLAHFRNLAMGEIGKKFDGLMLKGKARGERSALISDKMEGMFQRNQLWYQANIEVDETSRLTIFFAYDYCNQEKTPARFSFKEACFTYWVMGLYDNKWQYHSFGSEMDYILWKNRLPYMSINLEQLNDLSKATRLLQVVIPYPNIEGEVYSLKYGKNKLIWETGSMINWRLSSRKELDQFLLRFDNKSESLKF